MFSNFILRRNFFCAFQFKIMPLAIIEAQSEEEMEVTEPETVDTSAEQDLEGEEGEAIEPNPISELIGSIENKDYVAANNAFNSMLGDRMQAAIEAEKAAIADRIYNPQAAEAPEVEKDGEEVVAA